MKTILVVVAVVFVIICLDQWRRSVSQPQTVSAALSDDPQWKPLLAQIGARSCESSVYRRLTHVFLDQEKELVNLHDQRVNVIVRKHSSDIIKLVDDGVACNAEPQK